MAISAARSDMTLAVTGTDETTEMLSKARDNIAALEDKLKSLKTAGDAQAKSANGQTSALGNANKAMTGFARGAEGLVEGLDRTKGAFEKIVGAVGFWGVAVTGAIALGSELVALFSSQESELSKLRAELGESKKAADDFAASAGAIATQISGAVVATNTLNTSTAGLRGRLAALQGDLVGAEFERREAERLKMVSETLEVEKKIAETRAAQTKANELLPKVQAELNEGVEKEKALRAELETAQMDAKLGIKREDSELMHMKSIMFQQQVEENKANRGLLATTELRTSELENQVGELVEQKRLLGEIVVLSETAVFVDPTAKKDPPKDPPKPRGTRPTRPDAEALAMREIDAIREEFEAVAREREFEADLRDDDMKAIARQRKQAEAAEKAAEDAKKAVAEAAMVKRSSDTEGIYEFIGALGQLIPELGIVSESMQKVTDGFDKFRDGQISFSEAVATSATEVAASVARSLGGLRAEAAVRSAYNLAMGFATLATPWISAGHFTAAAMLAGVATGVIKTGGGGGASAPASGMGRPSQAQSASSGGGGGGGMTVNNYTLRAGVVDGQSTTRAFRRAEMASRNTGFAYAGGW